MLPHSEDAAETEDLVTDPGYSQGVAGRVRADHLGQSLQGGHMIGDPVKETLPRPIRWGNSVGIPLPGLKGCQEDLVDLVCWFGGEVVPSPTLGWLGELLSFEANPLALFFCVWPKPGSWPGLPSVSVSPWHLWGAEIYGW